MNMSIGSVESQDFLIKMSKNQLSGSARARVIAIQLDIGFANSSEIGQNSLLGAEMSW